MVHSKRVTVPGVPLPKGQTSFEIDYAAADSGLLGSIGLGIIRGRGITAAMASTAIMGMTATAAMSAAGYAVASSAPTNCS